VAAVPYEVLVGIDPLIGLAEIAERASESCSAVASWRANDRRFPVSVAELTSGPVFPLSAVIDYLAIRNGQPPPGTAERLRQLDAQARAAGDHTDWANPAPAEVEILLHNRAGLHVTPAWQWRSPSIGSVAGGTWMLSSSADDGDNDNGEAVEPIWEVRLDQLMERRDWEMWLSLHVQHLDEMTAAALALLGGDDDPPRATATLNEEERQLRLAAGALALSAALDELADAAVAKGDELRQRQQLMAHIGMVLALGSVVYRAAEADTRQLLDQFGQPR
jgi:hypothetical protein